MKQFVKSLNQEGDYFRYLGNKFPSISDAKLKAGVFDGPQIRKLLIIKDGWQIFADCWRGMLQVKAKKEKRIYFVGRLTIKEQGKDETTNIMEFFVG